MTALSDKLAELQDQTDLAKLVIAGKANEPVVELLPQLQATLDQARAATKSEFAATDGASLIGYGSRKVADKLGEVVSVKDFGAKGDGVTDDTAAIVAAVASALRVTVPDGVYSVTHNTIVLPDGVELCGSGTLQCLSTPTIAANAASPYFIRVTTNNRVSGLKFKGAQNRLYAVAGLSSAALGQVRNIAVEGIITDKAGIFTAQPELGFTFNDASRATADWINQGPVTSAHIASNISVSDCTMNGDATYKPSAGNTNDNNLAHGIVFMYATDCRGINNNVSNTRFGSWAYGGSAVAGDNLSVAANPLWNRNIQFIGGVAKEVFSGFWMARTYNGSFTGTTTEDFQDVTIDFEGCENCTATGNTTITRTVGGGSLTALFGCKDIVFSANVCRFEAAAASTNMVNTYVGNVRIKYVNNIFSNLGASVPKIIIRNKVTSGGSLSSSPSGEIEFHGNTLEKVDLLIEDISSAYVTGNRVKTPTNTNAVRLYNVPSHELSRNELTLTTDSALSGQSTSPVQIILSGMTFNKIDVQDNAVYGTTGDTGLTIFGAMSSACVANVSGNRVRTIFLDNSFVFLATNQTRGRVRFSENIQPVALDAEHIGMTVLKGVNGTESANPFVTYANAAPTVGTYKVGDIVYRAIPTAGGTMGWVCTTAGAPGTWKTFGTIAA